MFFNTSQTGPVVIRTSRFSKELQTTSCQETCSMLTISDPMLPYQEQKEHILQAIGTLSSSGSVPVFIRFFLSDPANQTALLKESLDGSCPVSIIGQAPSDGSKIAAWVWCRTGMRIDTLAPGRHKVKWLGTEELWYSCGLSDAVGPYDQTVQLLDELSDSLMARGMTLEDDCVRTWLFVQNIDSNYKGVVEGRNDVFDRHNLTPSTHFIASTGIEGNTGLHRNVVMLDAFGVKGSSVVIRHLYGASHLNRTSEYGVRFERGSVVEYPGFRHVFISGTASIDSNGRIMYEGDIIRQTGRMIENVEVLLAEAGCGFSDVAAITVYLRDPADFAVVKRIFDERFPGHPRVITLAPVCRPGWLVEMECVAIY